MTALRELPDNIFWCLRGTGRGHQWEEYQPLRRRASWGQPVSFECASCGKRKTVVWDSLGQVSYPPHYEKPPGYPIIEPHDGDDVRREALRRLRRAARQQRSAAA